MAGLDTAVIAGLELVEEVGLEVALMRDDGKELEDVGCLDWVGLGVFVVDWEVGSTGIMVRMSGIEDVLASPEVWVVLEKKTLLPKLLPSAHSTQ